MNANHPKSSFVRLIAGGGSKRSKIASGGTVLSDEWFTPLDIIRALGVFDLDPACGPLCRNRTARRRYERDGLTRKWSGRVWLNPPFSDAQPWIKRMAEHDNGILLCFARLETKWFQALAEQSGFVFVFRGRLTFTRPDGNPSSCPLGTALIPFGKQNVRAIEQSGLRGILLRVNKLTHHASRITPPIQNPNSKI